MILHRRVLDALVALGDADPGRLVHHAVACGDLETVLGEGPRAAREAASSGSHREAVSHYRTVLEHESLIGVEDRADLWGEQAFEQYLSGDASGVTAAERAVDLRRTDPDERRLVRSLCWLSRLAWVASRPGLALEAADEAVTRATHLAEPEIQALALANRSQLAMLHGQNQTAIELGEQAVAFAAEAGDVRIMSHALNNVGSSLMVSGAKRRPGFAAPSSSRSPWRRRGRLPRLPQPGLGTGVTPRHDRRRRSRGRRARPGGRDGAPGLRDPPDRDPVADRDGRL